MVGQKFEDKQSGVILADDERSDELMKLRKENKQLRMEKEILKRSAPFLREK